MRRAPLIVAVVVVLALAVSFIYVRAFRPATS